MMKNLTAGLALCCYLSLVVDAREEMGVWELMSKTNTICKKNSPALWEKVIRCHDPLTDDFLRKSDEANCPRSSSDPDPKDTSVPMQRVFETLCNAVGWNPYRIVKSLACLAKGHEDEVKTTQRLFGENTPENIVKCIRAIDLSKY